MLAGNFAGRLDSTEGLLGVLGLLTSQQVIRARRYDRQRMRDIARTVGIPDCFEAAVPDRGECAVSDLVDEPSSGLTDRQRSIVRMLAEGWKRDEIANRINCSLRTVDREIAASRAVVRDHLAGDRS